MVPTTTLNGGAGSLPLGQQLHGKKVMRPLRRLVPCAPARGPTAPVTGTLFPQCPKTPPPAQQSGASSHHSPPDDAAPPPHQGDATIVEGPAKFSGRLSQQHEALSVRDDLGSVEGLKGDTKSCSQPYPALTTGASKDLGGAKPWIRPGSRAGLRPHPVPWCALLHGSRPPLPFMGQTMATARDRAPPFECPPEMISYHL